MPNNFPESEIKEEIKLMDKEFEAEWENGYLKRQQEKRQPEERNKAIERLEQKQGQPKPKKSLSDKFKIIFFPALFVVFIGIIVLSALTPVPLDDYVCKNLQGFKGDNFYNFPGINDFLDGFSDSDSEYIQLDLENAKLRTYEVDINSNKPIEVFCEIPAKLCSVGEPYCSAVVVPFSFDYLEWKDWSKDKELIYKRGE